MGKIRKEKDDVECCGPQQSVAFFCIFFVCRARRAAARVVESNAKDLLCHRHESDLLCTLLVPLLPASLWPSHHSIIRAAQEREKEIGFPAKPPDEQTNKRTNASKHV
jgi:hypothetical protein